MKFERLYKPYEILSFFEGNELGLTIRQLERLTHSGVQNVMTQIKPYVKGIPISYSKEIIEIKMGKYEKGTKDDWSGYFKEAMNSKVPYHLYSPKNGESLQECYDRAGNFYLSLLKKYKPKDNILLVGHGIFSIYLILNILGLDLFENKYYQLSNASVSTIELDKKGKVKDFHVNDYHHLIYEGMKLKGLR